MALALLKLEDVDGQGVHFQVELGENAFYTYAIGDGTTERISGLPTLADPSFESELAGPLAPATRGRTSLIVPLDRFDHDHRHIQLMSFRTNSGHGPALSDILTVPATSRFRRPDAVQASTRLTSRRPRRRKAKAASRAHTRATSQSSRKAPFYLVEATSKGRYSTGMFWQALVGMLPQLLGAAGPLIGNLVGGLFGGGGKAAPTPASGGAAAPTGNIADVIASFLAKPENAKMIQQLVASAVDVPVKTPAVTPTVATPTPPAAAPNAGAKSLARMSSADRRLARQMDGGIISGPMIAMLITQLAPLLEKFISKETVNELLTSGTPQNLNKIAMDWAKFAADPFASKMERLWANTPQIGPSALPGLLATMEGDAQTVPAYKSLQSVKLTINGLAPVLLNGSPRVVYAYGRDIQLNLSIDTPRTITDATLYWALKHRDRDESYGSGTEELATIEAGTLPTVVIPAGAISNAPVNEPCSLCLYLVWKNRKSNYVGTERMQFVWFAGEYVYDRVEDAGGDPIALNDVAAHRDFWHKIWEGALTEKRRSMTVEAKYYYALDAADANVPLSTQKKARASDPVRIRSGMVLGLGALVSLRDSLGAATPLSAAQRAALDSMDFRNRISQAGLANVTLRGRAGERAALWVYPEVKLQNVILQQLGDVLEDGQLASFHETSVEFPLPVLFHLVGARTMS